jgi:uncharacterized damage-inducible protein DinB
LGRLGEIRVGLGASSQDPALPTTKRNGVQFTRRGDRWCQRGLLPTGVEGGASMNVEPLLESWDIHDRIHRYLLAELTPEQLAARAGGKGRTVGEQFVHLHNVRRLWLGSARPDLSAEVAKLDPATTATDPQLLAQALAASALAIRQLLASAFAEGRVKGFKPHPAAFLAYLIAHEAHHRGQVLMTLRLAGLAVSKKTSFGLWEWGVR